MKNIFILISLLFGIGFISCEVTDFELQENPNELTPVSVDANLVLNEIQILFAEAMNDIAFGRHPIFSSK